MCVSISCVWRGGIFREERGYYWDRVNEKGRKILNEVREIIVVRCLLLGLYICLSN